MDRRSYPPHKWPEGGRARRRRRCWGQAFTGVLLGFLLGVILKLQQHKDKSVICSNSVIASALVRENSHNAIMKKSDSVLVTEQQVQRRPPQNSWVKRWGICSRVCWRHDSNEIFRFASGCRLRNLGTGITRASGFLLFRNFNSSCQSA